MIILGLIVGILNGLFASGAGQILVFYLIFILKNDTHKSRALSVAILSISSIFTILGYFKIIKFNLLIVLMLIVIALISGRLGANIMKKIPPNILNLVSGILIITLTCYKFFNKG